MNACFRGWIGVVGVEKKRLPRRKERSRNGVADVGLGRPWGAATSAIAAATWRLDMGCSCLSLEEATEKGLPW